MPATRTILLLFEDEEVRREELLYSVELARRMACELRILMLVERKENGEEAAARVRFEESVARLTPPAVEIESELRSGDKASELLKFLALAPPVGTLVWGGNEKALTGRGDRKAEHWMAKLRSDLSCPIVTSMSRRAGADSGGRNKE